jgi:glycine oxidase
LKNTEILIVGHGLAGSLMAWELQQAGINYMVMNAPSLHRSSDVAGGLFNPLMFRKLRLSRMVGELWPVMRSTYAAIETSYNIKFLHDILSVKLLSYSELSEWEQGQRKITAPYIHAIEKGVSLKGFKKTPAMGYISSSGYLDIAGWLKVSQRRLIEKGLFFEEELLYNDLDISKERIVVNNLVEAGKIIFCEGAAAINNPWFQGDWLTPNKGEMLEILAPDLEEKFIVRDGVFLLPLGNKCFKVGATYSHDAINTIPTEEARNELLTKLEKMVSVSYKIVKHYAGIRPAIKDRMPVLGAHANLRNTMIFNGLGSRGVVFAPYCAKVLVKSLLSDNEPIPKALNINRFSLLPI